MMHSDLFNPELSLLLELNCGALGRNCWQRILCLFATSQNKRFDFSSNSWLPLQIIFNGHEIAEVSKFWPSSIQHPQNFLQLPKNSLSGKMQQLHVLNLGRGRSQRSWCRTVTAWMSPVVLSSVFADFHVLKVEATVTLNFGFHSHF